MKKYNKFDQHTFLLWIIIPILAFFVVINFTYSYFISHIPIKMINGSAGTIIISFAKDSADPAKYNISYLKTTTENGSESQTALVEGVLLLPGDVITIQGQVENTGNRNLFAIWELTINVTTAGATTSEQIAKLYSFNGTNLYTYDGTNLTLYSGTASTNATKIDAPNQKANFNLSYEFDAEIFGNEYINATVSYALTAHAIQEAGFTSANAATALIKMINE